MDKKTTFTLLFGIIIGIIIGYLGAQLLGNSNTGPERSNAGNIQDPKSQFMEMVQLKKTEVEKDPANIQPRIDLANMLFDVGEYSQAAEQYEEVLKIAPDNPEILSDLGVSYRNLGDSNRAMKCFQKGLEIKPDHVKILYNTAVVYYYDFKDPQKAKTQLEILMKIDPLYENALRLYNQVEATLKK